MNKTKALDILKEGFSSSVTYDDSKPLESVRHSLFIDGTLVEGLWLELHDAIHSAFIDWTEDGSWVFISPEHEKQYNEISLVFNKLFKEVNED